jgi:hypothetical protein
VHQLERPALRVFQVVRVGERFTDGHGDGAGDGQGHGEPLLLRELKVLREAETFDQLHRDEGPALGFTNVEDLDDVRVVHGGREARLGVEPLHGVARGRQVREQQLERDALLEVASAHLAGDEHLAHAARGQALEQLEPVALLVTRLRHGVRLPIKAGSCTGCCSCGRAARHR